VSGRSASVVVGAAVEGGGRVRALQKKSCHSWFREARVAGLRNWVDRGRREGIGWAASDRAEASESIEDTNEASEESSEA
jgi:hypothetical protein